MVRMLLKAGLAAAALLASAGAATAQTSTPSAIYVFGDSLSDRGNLAEALGRNFPNPPSYHDSFTNGNVALQVAAQRVGLSVDPSLWVSGFQDVHGLFGGASFQPGTNYAVAGATSAAAAVGGPTGINLPQQILAYGSRSGGAADPNALYTILIGGNDVRNAAKQGTGAAAITAGVSAELGAIRSLAGLGASNLLVINVPDVGAIPEFAQDNPALAASATTYSQSYDQQLAAGIGALNLGKATVKLFDLYGYENGLLANAASYGFTDITDRCYTNTPLSAAATPACGPGGANVDQFVYWDSVHPTARVDAIIGSALADAAFGPAAAVPEPMTWGMLGLGAGAIGFAMRRRRKETEAAGTA